MLIATLLLGMHGRLLQEASVSMAYTIEPVVCAGKTCHLSLCMAITWLAVIDMPYILSMLRMQEYVRQMLLEKIIHESEQAALREQAASLLAASHPVAARPGGLMGMGGQFSAPPQQPASGMKAFHQQHLQNQLLQVLIYGLYRPY